MDTQTKTAVIDDTKSKISEAHDKADTVAAASKAVAALCQQITDIYKLAACPASEFPARFSAFLDPNGTRRAARTNFFDDDSVLISDMHARETTDILVDFANSTMMSGLPEDMAASMTLLLYTNTITAKVFADNASISPTTFMRSTEALSEQIGATVELLDELYRATRITANQRAKAVFANTYLAATAETELYRAVANSLLREMSAANKLLTEKGIDANEARKYL